MNAEMKLYIFDGFCPDYTEGLAFAIASDEDEARRMIEKAYGYEPYCWGDLSVEPLDKPSVRAISGGG